MMQVLKEEKPVIYVNFKQFSWQIGNLKMTMEKFRNRVQVESEFSLDSLAESNGSEISVEKSSN